MKPHFWRHSKLVALPGWTEIAGFPHHLTLKQSVDPWALRPFWRRVDSRKSATEPRFLHKQKLPESLRARGAIYF